MPLKVKSVASGFVRSGKFSPARGGTRSSSNPLPVGRFVPARVRRLASGDVQVLMEQANPTAKRKKPAKKRKAAARKPKKATRRPVVRKTKRSAKKSKR